MQCAYCLSISLNLGENERHVLVKSHNVNRGRSELGGWYLLEQRSKGLRQRTQKLQSLLRGCVKWAFGSMTVSILRNAASSWLLFKKESEGGGATTLHMLILKAILKLPLTFNFS